jgi:hypothetical protein
MEHLAGVQQRQVLAKLHEAIVDCIKESRPGELPGVSCDCIITRHVSAHLDPNFKHGKALKGKSMLSTCTKADNPALIAEQHVLVGLRCSTPVSSPISSGSLICR